MSFEKDFGKLSMPIFDQLTELTAAGNNTVYQRTINFLVQL